MSRYKIVRFSFKSSNRTIQTGLTLAEAKEICSRDDSSGEGWFYGFVEL